MSSVIQVVTRIFSSRATREDIESLPTADSIGVPERVVRGSVMDPRTGINWYVETTFLKPFTVEPGINVDDFLVKKCEAIPGLELLKKYDKTQPPSNEICYLPGALDCDFPFTVGIPRSFGKNERPMCKLGHSESRSKFTYQGKPASDLPNESAKKDVCIVQESSRIKNSISYRSSVDKLASCDSETVDDPTNMGVQRECSSKNGFASDGKEEKLDSSADKTVDTASKMSISTQDLIKPLEKYFVDNKCSLCGFESMCKTQRAAKNHLLKHLTSKNFKCNVCDKSFKTPTSLSLHKVLHMQKKDNVSCESCDKKFLCRRRLARHKRNYHSHEAFTCVFCNREFSTKACLKSHLSIHTGERPYECDICNKKFRTSRSLVVHTTTHSETKDHLSCSMCNKKFRYPMLLKTHMNKHEKFQKFKCEICDKTFNFHSNMLQHKLVHFDVRRHGCDICGMKFKFPHHLKSHMTVHNA